MKIFQPQSYEYDRNERIFDPRLGKSDKAGLKSDSWVAICRPPVVCSIPSKITWLSLIRDTLFLMACRQVLSKLSIGVNLNRNARTYQIVTNPVSGEQEKLALDDYYVVDLIAHYEFTPQLSAQLNIENLLDEEYYDSIQAQSVCGYDAPRNIRLQMQHTMSTWNKRVG